MEKLKIIYAETISKQRLDAEERVRLQNDRDIAHAKELQELESRLNQLESIFKAESVKLKLNWESQERELKFQHKLHQEEKQREIDNLQR